MRRTECRKIGHMNGMSYRFRLVGNYHLSWSFAHTEEISGLRVRKYYMETYKEYGRDLMTNDDGNGIYE